MTATASPEAFVAGDLEIRPDECMVLARGEILHVTRRELALLSELARRAERVARREDLFESVWGRPMPARERSVDTYVKRLRAKLRDALPEWQFIHTHFAFGYRFSPVRLQDLHDADTPG